MRVALVHAGALFALAFAMLVAQSALAVVIPLSDWAPNLVLPMAIYLGVSQDVHLVRGALLSFVLGYLLDSFCGSPMGLQTFVVLASFLVARGTGLNLLIRGAAFQIVIMFVCSLVAGVSILALRAIFEPPSPFPLWGVLGTIYALVFGAIATALVSPPIFIVMRRLESLLTRRREESAAAGVE